MSYTRLVDAGGGRARGAASRQAGSGSGRQGGGWGCPPLLPRRHCCQWGWPRSQRGWRWRERGSIACRCPPPLLPLALAVVHTLTEGGCDRLPDALAPPAGDGVPLRTPGLPVGVLLPDTVPVPVLLGQEGALLNTLPVPGMRGVEG